MDLTFGFIGLGQMGKNMAANIADAGFPLTVCDVREGPVKELAGHGAISARNPADLAGQANCIFLSLPDTKVVEEVIFGENGLAGRLTPGSIIVDFSTIDYIVTVRIADQLKTKGITFIDAPVTGMEARAREGKLTVMAGGDLTAFEKIRPVLDVIGNNIVHVGKSGNGQLAKLVNQLFFNISAAALAELLPMAVKLGLDPEDVYNIVSNGTGQTFALKFFTPYILNNDFTPGYSLSNAYKDMASAMELTSRMEIPLPVFSAALQTYQMALAQGLGNENKGAMIKVWERLLGVEVRHKY